VFSDIADFSGMTGNKELQISQVIHQAFVEVAEYGTEAAAATAVGMEATSVGPTEPPKVFNADHPFIFIIQQKDTGNILFFGRMMDPSK
jgi:serpin B